MITKCSHCGVLFKCNNMDTLSAIREISDNFINHLANKHPTKMLEIQQAIQSVSLGATWFIPIQDMIFDNEPKFTEAYQDQTEKLLELLGLDEEGEEEENEDDLNCGNCRHWKEGVCSVISIDIPVTTESDFFCSKHEIVELDSRHETAGDSPSEKAQSPTTG